MHLDGDILAVGQFYRVANINRKKLEGKILMNPPKFSPPKFCAIQQGVKSAQTHVSTR